MAEAIISRGTKIRVAPRNIAGRVFPEETTFTLGASGAANATSLTITISPAITKPIKAPFFVNFIDDAGNEDLVMVTSDVAVGATTLTVEALTRAIANGAEAEFPPIFSARESASFTNSDTSQDINTFENDGHGSQIKTMIKNGLSINGFYAPRDAGWRTAEYCRNNFKDMYVKVEYPLPTADTGCTKGQTIEGFCTVNGAPIELSSTSDIAKSNIELMFNGKIENTPPS